MPIENKLSKDISLVGQEYVRMVDENGKSVLVPISALQNFITLNSQFAIYDGATSGAPYLVSKTNEAVDVPIRLGFSGPLTDETYFPAQYGALMLNQFSAPAGTSFDFRLLTLGIAVKVEFEIDVFFADAGGQKVNKDFVIWAECTFPNGDVVTYPFVVPNESTDPATQQNDYKARFIFNTYIKDILTDPLLGGGIRMYVESPLTASETLALKNAVVTVRI